MLVDTIKAGPVEFAVKLTDKLKNEDSWGEIDPVQLEIRITPDVEEIHQALTELHESIHLAYWMIQGKLVDNEDTVEALTMTLGSLFKDNPSYYIGLILRMFDTKKEKQEVLRAVKESL